MRKTSVCLFFAAILFILSFPFHVEAKEKILIAAASDLNPALSDICRVFEKENPNTKIDISYGSSGNFFAQIKHGAPYDIFFSADSFYPERLEEEGYAIKGKRQLYGVGRIVLWIPKKSILNVQEGLSIILDPEVKKLAIANPKHAPYGRAAEEALRYYNLWDKVQGKLIFGENVSQAAQFIQTGNADAGIIALSLALSRNMIHTGDYWIVPDKSHNELAQTNIVLQRGKNRPVVKTFLEFVQGEKGRKILSDYGFILP
jgi:molybdate transport system substrate-binding protein